MTDHSNTPTSVPSGGTTRLRLGARSSALSLAQSGIIARTLEALYPGLKVDIVPISTTGDEIQDRPLHEFGGKGLFTKQLEQALIRGDVDFAVHSYKDVPVTMPLVDQSNLEFLAAPKREDPRDLLVSLKVKQIRDLPRGATVGTGSLRRKAQLLDVRADLNVKLIRGNIDTRLRKLREGEFDAIILAMAGVRRAGFFDAAYMTAIPADDMLPAASQGALAIQGRRDRAETAQLLRALNDPDTALAVSLEREVIRLLDGDCHSPIGAFAAFDGEKLTLRATVARRDGTPPIVKASVTVARGDAESAPAHLVQALMSQGAEQLLCDLGPPNQ